MTWTSILLHCLLLYPVYQVLGTLRHELSHALAAVFQGVGVREIRIFPSRIDGKWYWGFVRYGTGSPVSRWVHAAPYLVNAAFVAWGFSLIPYLTGHEWLAAVILCWASPALDTLYNLCKWWFYDTGDFKRIVGEA